MKDIALSILRWMAAPFAFIALLLIAGPGDWIADKLIKWRER